ncbi:MAG: hypothetical protein M0T78_03705 [Actinomycetota bacterium]|nr:hypothetical protein [Actinomycetota bacterium]
MANDQRRPQFEEICKVVSVINRLISERVEETLNDLAHQGRVAASKRCAALYKVRDGVVSYLGIDR